MGLRIIVDTPCPVRHRCREAGTSRLPKAADALLGYIILFDGSEFTKQKISHLEINNSAAFNTFTISFNQCLHQAPKYCHHPKRKARTH